jgi:hypothetical protein
MAQSRGKSTRNLPWKWFVTLAPWGLVAAAVAMVQIGEFLFAELLLVLSTLAFFVQIWRWSKSLKVGFKKKQAIFFTVFLLVVLGIAALASIFYSIKDDRPWSNLWFQPITVYPNEFVLHTGQMSNTTDLILMNSGTKPLFGVQVEIWSDTPGIGNGGIGFEIDKNPDAIVFDNRFNSDCIVLTGIEGGIERSILQFYEVLPQNPRHIHVCGKKQLLSRGRARIISYRQAPPMLMKQ